MTSPHVATMKNGPALVPVQNQSRKGSPSGASFSFYQARVVETFENMRLGCLTMTLPDGSQMIFGSPGAEISADIKVLRQDFFKRCVLFGDIGFGESYVAGEWETTNVTSVISWFILNIQNAPSMSGSRARVVGMNVLRFVNRLQHLLRPNSLATSQRNISEHYDLGNEFYRLWLDASMTYSSARFDSPDLTLEQAQTRKYESLCRKLQLNHRDHVLEIGSGWGGFACHAARNYGCKVTSVTISKEQHAYAVARVAQEGLSDKVSILLQDYRRIEGQYSKIVSIEMLEAVGDKYMETFFAKCHQVLKPEGLLAMQYITCPDSRYDQLRKGVDWIQKHIFPGSLLLSVDRINRALRNTGDLCLHELEDMGLSYARTLKEWHKTFNTRLPQVRSLGFDEKFIRKWNYYLNYCEAAFAMRNISVVQAVYSRPNNRNLLEKGWVPQSHLNLKSEQS